jgi:hypothetical protein
MVVVSVVMLLARSQRENKGEEEKKNKLRPRDLSHAYSEVLVKELPTPGGKHSIARLSFHFLTCRHML